MFKKEIFRKSLSIRKKGVIEMKYLYNAIVVLFSLSIAVLIASKSLGLGAYAVLILIDYILILSMNVDFRKRIKNHFTVNKIFGSGNKIYGEVKLHSLNEDIEKIEPIAFEHFVSDLFKALGYKTKVTPEKKDFGGDVIIRKGENTIVIQVKHRDSSNWLVGNDAVQQAVAAMPVYKANRSMVVTNGEFTNHAYQQARFSKTLMLDGNQLNRLVRQVMIQESDKVQPNASAETHLSNEQDEERKSYVSKEDKAEMDIISLLDAIPPTAAEIESIKLKDLEKSVLADTIAEVTLESVIEEKQFEAQVQGKHELGQAQQDKNIQVSNNSEKFLALDEISQSNAESDASNS